METSNNSLKRKANSTGGNESGDPRRGKTAKSGKKWLVTRKSQPNKQSHEKKEIEAGDSGIWITCEKGKEGRCVAELRRLFEEHAARIYPDLLRISDQSRGEAHDEPQDDQKLQNHGLHLANQQSNLSIEDEIAKELDDIKNPKGPKLFYSIKLHDPCLLFFKTVAPINPTEFVLSFCQDLVANPDRKRAYAVQRLTPMQLIGKATESGISTLAETVLNPFFHEKDIPSQRFAIRTNLRNHHTFNRDDIIRQVAAKVGPNHKVDLKNFDLLILVELYKNLCGISVVGKEYDKFKRYNLSSLDPISK